MTDDSFRLLAACVSASAGIEVDAEQQGLLEARLLPLLSATGLRDVDALASRLRGRLGCGDELERQVIAAVTSRESRFFRDQTPFTHLRLRALPALHATRRPGQPLRLWSAATGSGQEAYSLAMLGADESVALDGRPIEILATDSDPAQLARARAGRYTQAEVQNGLPIGTLLRHFTKDGEAWQLTGRLRHAVRFAQHDLRDGAIAGRPYDVIFCRYVLAYFDVETKLRVLDLLHRQLAADGFLYCGLTDVRGDLTDRFAAAEEPGVYRPVIPRPKPVRTSPSWPPYPAV